MVESEPSWRLMILLHTSVRKCILLIANYMQLKILPCKHLMGPAVNLVAQQFQWKRESLNRKSICHTALYLIFLRNVNCYIHLPVFLHHDISSGTIFDRVVIVQSITIKIWQYERTCFLHGSIFYDANLLDIEQNLVILIDWNWGWKSMVINF